MFKSIALVTVACLATIQATSLTPIRAKLFTDKEILQLCVGNLVKAHAPGPKNIADVLLNLEQHKKFNCGPRDGPSGKALLDAILLSKGPCSRITLLNGDDYNNGYGRGGMDIELKQLLPQCNGKHGH